MEPWMHTGQVALPTAAGPSVHPDTDCLCALRRVRPPLTASCREDLVGVTGVSPSAPRRRCPREGRGQV